MNTKFILSGVLFLGSSFLMKNIAQTAEFIFVNNNSAIEAASLDIEVRVMPADTVYVKVKNIKYLNASSPISVPSSTILNINYITSGTSTVFYYLENEVFKSNDFRISLLYGESSKKSTLFTAHKKSSSSSKVKYDFLHSTPSVGEIDLVVRQTSKVIANDFFYGDLTFTFDDEIDATNYILDILPFNSNNGLYAYNFPGGKLGNSYVVLFTAGNSVSNDMYMVEMNGTVTKLTTTTAIKGTGIDEYSDSNQISVYPNPTINQLTVNSNTNIVNGKATIIISSILGETIINQPLQNSSTNIDISYFAKGIYYVKIISAEKTITKKIIKE